MTLALALLTSTVVSCKKETRDKIKQAKQHISNATTVVEKAKAAEEEMSELKDAVSLTNTELKEWLPESLGDLNRTGFKVGTAGYMNVASIEGTFKSEDNDKKISIQIIDGAGQMGSVMIASLGFASKMDMEEEDENRHLQTVDVNGIKAQQTYLKKRNETKVQFVYEKRFGVIVDGLDMSPEETWELIDKLNLEELVDKTK
jgi:hypothetical protein